MSLDKKKIVAVLSDLMFMVKIQDAAKQVGLPVVVVQTLESAMAQAHEDPQLIILDLNTTALNALDLIAKLKADKSTSHIRLVGFVSHVQIDLKKAAQEKGCDTVIARSAFSQNLPGLLQPYV